MSAPTRIQRRRAAGWRMPDGAVYVGRPTRWGNPYKISGVGCTPESAVALFEDMLRRAPRADDGRSQQEIIQAELRGRDLACWCPLDQPCHADVLLALANPPDHECDGEESWCWPCEYRERFRPPADDTRSTAQHMTDGET